ncbi:MAG: hypothetical protein CM15mP74_08130 [Halieaceae bacterium]|nr:MAG: hypothetical protein CM15mP74_08130 [Halieaceae bacterium]
MSYRVIFSHANGYPAGSYRVLTEAIGTQYSIRPFDHRPLWGEPPPGQFLSWQTYANDLIERIEADQAGPVWLIGHSMGAASGILAAARRPELFAGIVALDPVLVPNPHLVLVGAGESADAQRDAHYQACLGAPS